MRNLKKTILIAAILLCSIQAVAQESPTADPSMPWWQQVLIAFFVGLGGLVLEFMRRGLTKLFDYFAERSHLAFLAKVDDVMMGVVTSLYNVEVEAVKEAAADGKLTADEKAKFKQLAIDEFKSLLGVKGIGKLGEIFGTSEKVESVIAHTVEKAVTASKIAGGQKDPR